jgi:hypothetical protein
VLPTLAVVIVAVETSAVKEISASCWKYAPISLPGLTSSGSAVAVAAVFSAIVPRALRFFYNPLLVELFGVFLIVRNEGTKKSRGELIIGR